MDEKFKSNFGESNNTYCQKTTLDYLNLFLTNQDDGSITIDQESYIALIEAELADDHPARLKPFPKTTADPHLFRLDGIGETLSDSEVGFYKSMVQKLAFIAQKMRPDILCATSFLATWVRAPTKRHLNALYHLMRYVFGTKKRGLKFSAQTGLKLVAYIDAVFSTHYYGRSQSGMVMGLDEDLQSMVVSRSGKIKLVCDSSTEAEVTAVHKYVEQVLWADNLFREMTAGRIVGEAETVTIFQDNLSALVLEHNGAKPLSKSSHTNRRFFKVRQLVNSQRVKLEWKGTLEMRADTHTKITSGKKLTRQVESYMEIGQG